MDKPPDDMPMPAGFRHKVKRLQKECCTRTSHGKEGGMERYEQTTLFPKEKPADVMPSSTSWNLWHGCRKCSPGCWHCYVYRRDAEFGRDSSVVNKTKVFRKPVQKYRTGPRKGEYKYPSGTTFLTCFTSDFFIAEADEWRPEAWAIMRERSDCYFYMITKRPERILDTLPADWGKGYPNVHICCTCENQRMTDKRLSIYLELPLPNKSIIHEPMLEQINIRPYLEKYGPQISSISCGGESGPGARICDYGWVLDTHMQCVEYGVPFSFHQTGARLRKGEKIYEISREYQHEQAHKAHLDFNGVSLPEWDYLSE